MSRDPGDESFKCRVPGCRKRVLSPDTPCMLHRSHDLGDDDKPKRGFPPSFDQLRAMGNTPPVKRSMLKEQTDAVAEALGRKRTLDPERAAAGIEAARATVQQLQAVERFHRHVEQAALAAFREMLAQLGQDHDLRFCEPDGMQQLAESAWNWGLVFAEARKPEK